MALHIQKSLWLGLILCPLFSFAQDIVVEPIKDYLRADSVHAKYGEIFSGNDPFGRKTFAQWIVKDAELFNIELDKPVLFVAQFTVDHKGRNKKVKVLQKGNVNAAKLLATAIEEAPRWKPYFRDGVPIATEETIAIVLLPPKSPGGDLRGGTSIAPIYPKDGIGGFLAWLDSKIKDSDWRYDHAALLRKKLKLQVRFTVGINGELSCEAEGEATANIKSAVAKLFEKCELWQPGIFVTRPCPYNFVIPIEIPAWNEKLEGEKIIRQSQQKKTQVQLELEKRYQERQQQR